MSCCNNDNKPMTTTYSLMKAGSSIIKHYLNPTYNAYASEETKNERILVCKDCELLTSFMGKQQCKACKCFIELKTSLVDQTCPHPKGNKWKK